MAGKAGKTINLNFSLAESIIAGINSTQDVKIGSVNINITNVKLAAVASEELKNGNELLGFVNTNVESAKNNYESVIKSFKSIQDGR